MNLIEFDRGEASTLTLNRPDIHNAFNSDLIRALIEHLDAINKDPDIRVVILKGNGKSFCAGADMNWMKSMINASQEENYQDSMELDKLMYTLNTLSKPTIAYLHGAVFGGGIGLAACCDITIAQPLTKFCLSEVKIGLIPAVISPYVIAKIGVSQARRYFLTAEVFDTTQAIAMGLIHESSEAAEAILEETISSLLKGGPKAQKQAKNLVFQVDNHSLDLPLRKNLAQQIASLRVSPEGQAGLSSFLDKKKAPWVRGGSS